MHSRFNDGQTEHFVEKLNKSLRWTPASVRTELHAELRQHLEALAAAYEELGSSREEAFDQALRQFGDPSKIGRQLWWEWLRGTKPLISPECQAALHMLAVYVFFELVITFPTLLEPALKLAPLGQMVPYSLGMMILRLTTLLFTVGIPLTAGFSAGRKFPRYAVKAALWISMAPMVWIVPALGLSQTPFGQDTLLLAGGGIGLAAFLGSLGAFLGGETAYGRQKITHRQ